MRKLPGEKLAVAEDPEGEGDAEGAEHEDEGEESRVGLHLRVNRTRRCGPLRGPSSSSCRGLRQRPFLPFGQNKGFLYLFWPKFWSVLVISSNLSNF